MLGKPSGRVYASAGSDRPSTAILAPRNSAHNSGHSAHRRPAETHKCTALGLIYLQNRRSTTELRPQALLRLGSPKQAKMSSGFNADSRTAHVERIIFVARPDLTGVADPPGHRKPVPRNSS